jgi:hypothetical protein
MPVMVHIAATNFKGLRNIKDSIPVISQRRPKLLPIWKDSGGGVVPYSRAISYGSCSQNRPCSPTLLEKVFICASRFSQIVCIHYSVNTTTGFHNKNAERKLRFHHKRNIVKEIRYVSSQWIWTWSVFCIVTKMWDGVLVVPFLTRKKGIFLSYKPPDRLWFLSSLLYDRQRRVLSSNSKRPERDANHSSSFSAEFRNELG